MHVVARVHGAQRDEGPDEERRANEQHQRQPHFDDDQDGARAVLPEAAAGAVAAFLNRRVEIDARRLQRRYEAEDQAGQQRNRDGEGEHAPVDADPPAVEADARDVARVQRQQRADADDTQDHADRAAGGRKGDTFGQELADDAAAAGADRGADRHLAPPDGRANEEKIRDIRARDQQDERDRADQHEQRRAHVAHHDLLN